MRHHDQTIIPSARSRSRIIARQAFVTDRALCQPWLFRYSTHVGQAMKIVLRKTSSDAYELIVGDTHVALDGNDVKNLSKEISNAVAPVTAADEVLAGFLRRIKRASDVGIQALLRSANRGDVLVLLKVAENDQALLGKFHANMSERSRKIFTEDLAFPSRSGCLTPRSAPPSIAYPRRRTGWKGKGRWSTKPSPKIRRLPSLCFPWAFPWSFLRMPWHNVPRSRVCWRPPAYRRNENRASPAPPPANSTSRRSVRPA